MKKFIFLYIASILLFSCSATKDGTTAWNDYLVVTPCPPKTECTFEAIKDKSLLIKTDDTGHIYYNLQDTPGKTVLKYTYKKITDADLQDAGYSETIIFETDSNNNLNLTGRDIQKTNMLFNVQCFCRGKAGAYKVEEGTMTYVNKKLTIALPQIVDGQLTKNVTISHK